MKVYFHHIPKTAGTSLRNVLIAVFGASNVSQMFRGEKFRDVMRAFGETPVIAGHLRPMPGDELPSARRCITLLREPVDRAISAFFFERNSYGFGRSDDDRAPEFVEWVAGLETEDARRAMNVQLDFLWPFGWHEQSLPSIDARIDAAKHVLDKFDVVGMQDSMAETIALLSYVLDGRALPVAPHDNKTPGRIVLADLATDTLRRLRKILEPDQEVYEHARKLFRKQQLALLFVGASFGRPVPPVRGVDEIAEQDAAMHQASPDLTASPAEEISSARVASEWGSREVIIDGVDVRGEISEGNCLQVGECASLRVHFCALSHVTDLTVGIAIRDDLGHLMFGTNTRLLGDSISVAPGKYAAIFSFPTDLGLGRYGITAALHRGGSHLEGCFHWLERAGSFEVLDQLSEPFEGRVRLRVSASVESLDGAQFTLAAIEASGSKAAYLARRNAILSDFSACLKPLAQLESLARGSDAVFVVEVHNSGSQNWPAFGKRAVNVSYRWLDSNGNVVVHDAMRTGLPHDVPPGARLRLSCFLRAPETAGAMKVAWTLVQEGVAWFVERNPSASTECRVSIF